MPLDKSKSSKSIVSGEVPSTSRLQTISTTSGASSGVIQSIAPSPYLAASRAMSSQAIVTGNNIVGSTEVTTSGLTCQQGSRQQQCHHYHHHHHYNTQKQRRPTSTGSKGMLVSGTPKSHLIASAFEPENSTTCSSSGGEQITQQTPTLPPTTTALQSQVSTTSSPLPPAIKIRLYELFGQIEKEFEVLYSENLGLQEHLEQLGTVVHPNLLPGSTSTSTISTLTNNLHLIGDINLNNPSHTVDYGNKSSQMYSYPSSQRDPNQVDAINHNHDKHQQSLHKFQQSQHPYPPPLHQQNMQQIPQQPPVHQKSSRVHKLRSHTNRLRQQTTRIMSNFASKGPSGSSAVNCTPLRRYIGHRDGVWEVSVSKMGLPIIGTASADHTAIVWGMHSGRALLQYTGHKGSVNSLRFHPSKELVLTASGDGSVHIWQCAVHLHNESSSGRMIMPSSEDELEYNYGEKENRENNFNIPNSSLEKDMNEENEECSVLRTPLRSLTGHHGVVIAADWLPGGEQAVTAGWDRLACIWDTQTGQLLHQLGGHDEELTHTAAHPTQRLVVTSSKDSTFRLWDFREAIHSVSVFQGHQDTVTSAIFTSHEEKIISGSDDRSARIWDLRNMRSPVATIQSDSAINRLAVSSKTFGITGGNVATSGTSGNTASPSGGLIAIPFDNRNVRLYDMNGQRIGRLPRSSRQQGHSRMVCCTAWSEPNPEDTKPNLFTCGFDRVVLGWSIQRRESASTKDTESLNATVASSMNSPALAGGSSNAMVNNETVCSVNNNIMGAGGGSMVTTTAAGSIASTPAMNNKISISLRGNKELGSIKDNM